MATATKTAEKILVYDGDCPMCTSTVASLVRLKLVRPEQTRANYDLTGADLEAANSAGIRNQLVVLDVETHQTRVGTDGLLWILRDNTGNHFLVRLLALPLIRDLLRWGYQIVSYNRRIISVPRHQIVCDCEPQVTLARRTSLIVPVALLAILLAAGFARRCFTVANWATRGPARHSWWAALARPGWRWPSRRCCSPPKDVSISLRT